MQLLKKLFPSALAFIVLNACGTSPKESAQQPNPVNQTETKASDAKPQAPVTETQPMEMPSRTDEAVKAEPAPTSVQTPAAPSAAAPTPTPAQDPDANVQVNCAFNINGKSYVGNTKAECDKLKKDLGFQF
jgi:hypothetical protein